MKAHPKTAEQDIVHKFYAEHGRPPSTVEYEQLSKGHARHYRNITVEYGTWKNFIERGCGLDYVERTDKEQREALTIAEARRIARLVHGDSGIGPTMAEYTQYLEDDNAYRTTAIMKRYGGWFKFLEACGLRAESRAYYLKRARERQEEMDQRVEDEIARVLNIKMNADEWKNHRGMWAKPKVKRLWNRRRQAFEPTLVYELI